MDSLAVTIKDCQDVPSAKIVSIVGDVDELSLTTNVIESIKTIMATPEVKYVIIDLSGITFMNSKGIGYLIALNSSMAHNNQQCILAGTNPGITELISMIGIEQLIPYYHTVEDALKSITSSQ